jgi:hypothetical protein
LGMRQEEGPGIADPAQHDGVQLFYGAAYHLTPAF